MTDAEITHTVEQATLGGMTLRPRRAAQLRIGPEHFTDPRHQAIAAALTGTAGTERGLFGRIMAFFTRRSRAAREAAAYMETLPDLCPDPAHLGTYFQMLVADRDQRAAEARARVQVQGNHVLDVAAERLGQMRGRADASTGLPRGTARLARALQALTGQQPQAPAPAPAPGRGQAPQAQGPAPTRASGPAPAQVPQGAAPQAPVPQQANGRPAQGPAGQPTQNASAPAPVPGRQAAGQQTGQAAGPAFASARFARPEDLQDAILAAMMRHPDEAREVTGWLTPQAFGGQRRELFTLISQYDQAGRDIDPVTLAWGAAQPAPDGQPGRLRPEFILRTGALDTAPGTASLLGRVLLADQVVTRELGPDWHLAQQRAPAPAGQAAAGTPQSAQAQTQTQGQQQSQGQGQQQGQQPGQGQQQSQQSGPAPSGQPGQQGQRAPQNQGAPQGQRAPQGQAAQQNQQPAPQGPPGPAGPNSGNQGQPTHQAPGPYRQGRPGNGPRQPSRAGSGTGPAAAPIVPGTLIQQPPPPVPGQGGMSPHQ